MRSNLSPPWLLLFATTIAAATTNTVSLSDFFPKITTSLTSACNTVYNEAISGCTTNDFLGGSQCSMSCLEGLVQITAAVQASCQSDSVSKTSIIGLFKAGQGIQALCNVAVVTTTADVTTAATTESIGQSTMIVSSVSMTTGGLLTDSSMPSSPSMTLSFVTSSSLVSKPTLSTQSPSKTGTSPTSKTSSSSAESESQESGNTQSGGGSPFDVTNNSRGLREASVNQVTALGVIALGLALLLR